MRLSILAMILIAQTLIAATAETASAITVEMVRHLTRVKILESNTLSLRPGSIYDNITVFESIMGVRPNFKYEFVDTGLGTAEPLYPMYQKGYQKSWLQLLPAFFSEKNRHIDHFTQITTPEGCLVDSLYMLRHIDEFPKNLYAREREEGYDLIVIRLEHFTRIRSNAECGRHVSNLPDPNFKVQKFLKRLTKVQTFADFPAKDIARFEAKISAIRHISERRGARDLPKIDEDDLSIHNSLWYYPKGHAPDYGINQAVSIDKDKTFKPADLVFAANENLQSSFSLARTSTSMEFQKIYQFMLGQPVPGFLAASEPGNDTLDLRSRDLKYFYTSGLEMIPTLHPEQDASSAANFKLVGFALKPFETIGDAPVSIENLVPQIRLVYQLMNPLKSAQPLEQLYLHLNFDILDRTASPEARAAKMKEFLQDWRNLVQNSASDANASSVFLTKYLTQTVETVSFSSSVTGIWIFGQLTRNHDLQQDLVPLRIVRNGVDVGYYSSSFDNDLFRQAIKNATGERKAQLEQHMDNLTVTEYRDAKRMNVEKIRFDQVTCAQCHQLSGRDAVHLAFNDHIDSRFTSPIRGSEFLFHESLWQLKKGEREFSSLKSWLKP